MPTTKSAIRNAGIINIWSAPYPITTVPQDHGGYWEEGYYPVIPDGDYHIVSALGDQWWLTNAGFSMDDGGNVQLWEYNDMECDHHLYNFEFIPDGKGIGRGFYKITNKLSGKCLSSEGSNEWLYNQYTGKRANVQQWTYCSSALEWAVNEIDGGARGMLYTFQARCSGYYMDVEDGIAASGTNISMWKGNDSAAQQWRPIPWAPSVGRTIEDGEYQIAPLLADNKVVSIAENAPKNGTNVELNSNKGNNRHTFDVKYEGNGYYSIINKYSGLSLDVQGGPDARKLGSNIQLWEHVENNYAQKWIIKSCGDGYYQVISACNGLYLDAQNGGREDGSNIGLYKGGEENQYEKWKFIPYVEYARPKLSPLTASLPSGSTVEAGTKVSLSCGVDRAAIYYTLDGTYPTAESLRYSGPIVIEKETTITAYAAKEGYQDSATAIFTYMVKGQDNVPEDDSGRGDVLEEDIPQGKVENIPRGLWMSAVPPQDYTGKAVKPTVRVYDYKTLLTEKKDYTISYKNNTKAGDASGSKPPTIIVTGKGNYIGKETQTFVIRPKCLSDADVAADDITLLYNGKTRKPVPVITWNGKKLTKNRDYTVSYPDEERNGAANPGAYREEGSYTVRICGVGNYTGEREVCLTIAWGKLMSGMKVDKIAPQVYTGEAVEPVLTVRDGRNVLMPGGDYEGNYEGDYEVSWQDNVEVGQATAVITGKGVYAGIKKVSFKIIQKASLTQAKAELKFEGPAVYTGGEVKPVEYKLTVSAKNADGSSDMKTLEEGTDFTVSYKNNTRPGTASIVFQGINGYTGTLKKTYKISAYNIGEDVGTDNKIHIELDDSYTYTKGGCKPEPVVTFQGKVLQKGTDYTLSYKNNTALNDGSNPKKLPAVKIKGKGCFTGVRERVYQITAKDIGGLTMSATDKVWQNKKNIYRTKVVIRDADGKALSAGKDYEKLFRYEYGADTTLPDGTVRKAGEEVSGNDILPAGTVIRVTASAKGSNYTGTLTGSYRITAADIGKAKVTIPAQTYTGREIRPDQEIQVKLNGQVLSEDNYVITGYANNINKGTATVTIKGRNDCGGVKTVKFKIRGKGFLWWWR